MKLSHYFSLLRFDFYTLWGVLALSVIYGFQNGISPGGGADQMFSVGLYGPEIFLLIIPFISINPLFLGGNYGIQSLKGQAVNSLEFFFSHAIRRSLLFSVKASLYLGLTLMPLLTIWGYSYTKPIIRIELPYNTLEHREATKQFYLTHFEGAYLQKDEKDKEGNKYWVILPKGQVDRARFTLVWVFACTLLFQAVLFALSPAKRWASIPIYFGLLGVTTMGGSSVKVPSSYEMGLAWVAQHTFLSFVTLGLITLIVELYCCRRFVNTEITP
jgi:hypothetical protein